MQTLDYTDSTIRIIIALVLGGAIGFQREQTNKPAGLRTYSLVSLGAALFMLASLLLAEEAVNAGNVQYDPSRIASTIVQGIGFLAAGVIFSAGGRVHGLTSAAALWVTAAIGLLTGAGFWETATIATLALIFVLGPLNRLETHPAIRQSGESGPTKGRMTFPEKRRVNRQVIDRSRSARVVQRSSHSASNVSNSTGPSDD